MKRQLKKAFMAGVDGASANLFARVRYAMETAGMINGIGVLKTVTIGDLYQILCEAENKQDKEIDKYLNGDQRIGSK